MDRYAVWLTSLDEFHPSFSSSSSSFTSFFSLGFSLSLSLLLALQLLHYAKQLQIISLFSNRKMPSSFFVCFDSLVRLLQICISMTVQVLALFCRNFIFFYFYFFSSSLHYLKISSSFSNSINASKATRWNEKLCERK